MKTNSSKPIDAIILTNSFFKVITEVASLYEVIPYLEVPQEAFYRKGFFPKKIKGYILTGFVKNWVDKNKSDFHDEDAYLIDLILNPPVKNIFITVEQKKIFDEIPDEIKGICVEISSKVEISLNCRKILVYNGFSIKYLFKKEEEILAENSVKKFIKG